jgi:hypothetical protein
MAHGTLWKVALGAAVSSAALFAATAAMGETLIGKTIESRVVLAFKVADAGVQPALPDGWVPFTFPKGPVAGANLVVAMIDRHAMVPAEGEPDPAMTGPTVAVMAYARKDGVEGIRGFVTRVFEEPPMVDPYGTSVPADIDRTAGYTDKGGGVRRQTESWTVRPEAGGEMSVDLSFDVARFNWSTGNESRPYSAVNPEFHRIYRYDQLVALAMSEGLGLELKGTVDFNATGPDLAGLFDGSEELVTIMAIPTYVREVSLP